MTRAENSCDKGQPHGNQQMRLRFWAQSIVWWLGASLLLHRWMLQHPQWFPPIPESVWNFFDNAWAGTCCDDTANVEAVVSALVALALVGLCTVAAFAVVRLRRPKH